MVAEEIIFLQMNNNFGNSKVICKCKNDKSNRGGGEWGGSGGWGGANYDQ